MTIKEGLAKLMIANEDALTRNETVNAQKRIYSWHALRTTTFRIYFELRTDKAVGKMRASNLVAKTIYRKSEKYNYISAEALGTGETIIYYMTCFRIINTGNTQRPTVSLPTS